MKKEITQLTTQAMKSSFTEVQAKPLGRLGERARLMLLDALGRWDRAYLPFSQFQDCMVGTAKQRDEAFLANKQQKKLILPYLAAWSLRGLAMGAGMATAANVEAMGVQTTFIQVGFALGLCGCIVICSVLWVGWLGLTFLKE